MTIDRYVQIIDCVNKSQSPTSIKPPLSQGELAYFHKLKEDITKARKINPGACWVVPTNTEDGFSTEDFIETLKEFNPDEKYK